MADIMSQQSLTLDTFLQDTHHDIESKIKDMISDDKILTILKGGKRLRPLLASIAFKTCTGGEESKKKYQEMLEGSVGVELAHGASLVHDDIIDGDLSRRGEPAYYIKSGIDNAILTGHKMLVIGFSLALSHGEKIAKLYIDTWRSTLEGQLSEINFNSKDLNNTNISRDSRFFQIYSMIIDLKTASLFSAACKAAAIWAGVSDELADLLGDYGREVGFAYQLADDLVDLEKGEMIDSVVIPLLSQLERQSMKDGSLKAKAIKDKIKRNSSDIKKLYLDEINKHILKARDLSQSDLVPRNQYRRLLRDAPSYIINRMLKEIRVAL